MRAGFFCDPPERPGLAHFLEHLLFFSSERFPEEDEYSKFVTEHGGRSNAYTAAEETNYQFDVNWDSLEEALDRFSCFFTCPLLSQDAVDRELNAVNSENDKNLQSDLWRGMQLGRTIARPEHPFSKFGTGDKETLGGVTREEVVTFYRKYYSSNLLNLVVLGRHTLDELQALVERLFSPMRDQDLPVPSFSGEILAPEHRGVRVRFVPIRERHTLELSFVVPPEAYHYRASPSRYLGHLIGHEGEGSIFARLKALGWATSLAAGESDASTFHSTFYVSVDLTDEGQAHAAEIVGMVEAYLKLLRKDGGVARWIFDEVARVSDMHFRFRDTIQPYSYCTSLARCMQLYPAEDLLCGGSVVSEYDPEGIRALLDALRLSDARLLHGSREHEPIAAREERWYGTKFEAAPLPLDEWRGAWEEGSSCGQGLALPAPNDFIPSSFDLLGERHAFKSDAPEVVRQTELSRLWWKPDTAFDAPKAILKLDLSSPAAYASPEAAVCARLYVELLTDALNELVYPAEIAGLAWGARNTTNGLQITCKGYNDKLLVLAEKVFRRAVALSIDDERFAIAKEKVTRSYKNCKFEQPYQTAMYESALTMEHHRWHVDEYLDVIDELGVEDMRYFVKRLWARCWVEAMCVGNVAQPAAEAFMQDVVDGALREKGAKRVLASQRGENRVVRLEAGAPAAREMSARNEADKNSAIDVALQLEVDSPRVAVLSELFVQLAQRAAHHQLRSVEQLGYIVFCLACNTHSVRRVMLLIQSSVKDAAHLDRRVDVFMAGYGEQLRSLSEEEFAEAVQELLKSKLEKDKTIFEEAARWWNEIDSGNRMFDRREREVAEIRRLRREDLLQFYEERLRPGAPQERRLATRVFSAEHRAAASGAAAAEEDGDAPEAPPRGANIDCIYAFKRALPLFESLK